MAKVNKKKEEEMKPEETKELATVSSASLPVVASFSIDEDVGLGQENMGAEDFAIPRIGIVQSLSPQRSKTKPEYIEGCVEGQIFENVTKKIFDGEKGIHIVPVYYSKKYLEWVPRKAGGGLAADHGADSSIIEKCKKNDKGQYFTESGNEVIPTSEYYVFIVDTATGLYIRAVLSMAKSFVKASKRLNTMINQLRVPNSKGDMVNPPMFYQAYNLVTVPESNEQGEWFRWEIKEKESKMLTEIPHGDAIYAAAKEFRRAITLGEVKTADHNTEMAEEDESAPM